MEDFIKGLSIFERCLWCSCVCAILVSSSLFWDGDVLSLAASLIGVTALVFLAKGNWIGQILIIIFALIYGVISVRERYFGEAISYVGMSVPISAISAVEWIRNPFQKGKNEVAVSPLSKKKVAMVLVLCVGVTLSFYFILKQMGTANLPVSTMSIATSFFAASLLFLRSNYYALGYALNDIVLVILWSGACLEDLSKLPVVVCFICFFINDTYGFINWKRMRKRQLAQI